MKTNQLFIALTCCVSITISSSIKAEPDTIIIDDYRGGISTNWQIKSFAGKTTYVTEKQNNEITIRAESKATASGLFYEIKYNPAQYPILSWSWKIKHVLEKGDAKHKTGDDYAARIYVVFPSWMFWKTRALNYVWANKLPQGEMIANAFTANAMMIAVRSGSKEAGTWRKEQRNIYEDFQKAFGEEPPMTGAIAIMTDTDNTGETASAWYGPISISKQPELLNKPTEQ